MSEQDYREEAQVGNRPSGMGEPLTRIEPIPVRVRFACEVAGGRWQFRQWRLVDVSPTDESDRRDGGTDRGGDGVSPDGASPGGGAAAPLAIELFPDEAQGYYLNLTSGEPSIMVKWRLPEDESGIVGDAGEPLPLAVTLSYDEAGRWMDGGERVDRVPMPAAMAEWLAEFVRLHWKPEEKRKRRGPRPSFMSREEFEQMVERERRGGVGGR
ncbi:MAG: DUF3305 domain-containing protein [Limnobacter sp.]|nr:DUF3305 domain-containing protein [Limnobacter sp.]